jgi:hypothetical protein
MRFLTITLRRSVEYLHICLNDEEEVIYYWRKYTKLGWELVSVDESLTTKTIYANH